jgi:hypothetical protein
LVGFFLIAARNVDGGIVLVEDFNELEAYAAIAAGYDADATWKS